MDIRSEVKGREFVNINGLLYYIIIITECEERVRFISIVLEYEVKGEDDGARLKLCKVRECVSRFVISILVS